MFSAIRRRIHFSPATVIAGLALVFAMSGGAYAAKKYLITSTKQISPSVLKALQGRAGSGGVPGVAGAAGVQGPAGPAGPVGPAGSGGAKGETGPGGAKGTTGAAGAAGVKGATGATGASGATGFTATLPSGKTETGSWTATGFASWETTQIASAISFPIPLPEPSEEVVYLNRAETLTSTTTPVHGCEYNASDPGAMPVAPAGELCVFTLLEQHGKIKAITTPEMVGDRVTGAFLKAQPELFEGEIGWVEIQGVWAVSAK
jgi:Collagen triple helix repeat (20 copies)